MVLVVRNVSSMNITSRGQQLSNVKTLMFKNTTSRNLNQSRFSQSMTDPQLVCKTVTFLSTPITVQASINEVLYEGVHIQIIWRWGQSCTQCSENQIHYTLHLVPSMSNSWPWLPSRVRERKGAKSTKISLSRGATFSKALSSFVVMLSRKHIKTHVTK